MFSKVLVATDLSSASLAVVDCVGALRSLGTRECVLVHCCDMPKTISLSAQIQTFLEGTLGRQKDTLERQGFATSVRVVPGLPQLEIPRVAKEEQASLIAVGSHGQSLGSEILLGGVACEVVHGASTPVLVFRLETGGDRQPDCVGGKCDFSSHVLVPTDFSENSEQAFRYLQDVAKCGAKRVTLLHVQDKTRLAKHLEQRLEEFNRIDLDRLERLKAQLQETGDVDVQIEIPFGKPAAEIIERTRKGQVTLVIMGSHGRGFVSDLFIGSVSHNVARHAEAPVLLVPMRSERKEA